MTLSVVLILPDAYKKAGNSFATQMGWQEEEGDTFSIALTPDGKTTTHWGTHASAEDDGPLVKLFSDPPKESLDLLGVMVYSLRQYDNTYGMSHFKEVCEANGLNIYVTPDSSL